MARDEQSPENLLTEATALVERIEISLPDGQPNVVLGFRRNGAASIYFGEDPAYHFNAQGQLRRAFIDGQLVKAERGRLVAMTRRRTDREVQLCRRELNAEETVRVADDLLRRMAALANSLGDGGYRVVGQVPDGADVLGRGQRLLRDMAGAPKIAQSPHA
jgi:hypothetical protein